MKLSKGEVTHVAKSATSKPGNSETNLIWL